MQQHLHSVSETETECRTICHSVSETETECKNNLHSVSETETECIFGKTGFWILLSTNRFWLFDQSINVMFVWEVLYIPDMQKKSKLWIFMFFECTSAAPNCTLYAQCYTYDYIYISIYTIITQMSCNLMNCGSCITVKWLCHLMINQPLCPCCVHDLGCNGCMWPSIPPSMIAQCAYNLDKHMHGLQYTCHFRWASNQLSAM